MTEFKPQTTSSQLPIRKRKKTEDEDESHRNITTSTSESNLSNDNDDVIQQTAASMTTEEPQTKIMKMTPKDDKYQQQLSVINSTKRVTTKTPNKARETRLEQNRKAARESRRRKKVMVEDLQRSVIFFSRANGTIKHQNDELTRLLMQAQAQVSVIESTKTVDQQQQQQQQQNLPASNTSELAPQSSTSTTANSTNVPVQAATSAVITATAAPAGTYVAAQSSLSYPSFPVMQTGATMQAMANFQQAAAAAMQAAVQGMQQGSIPGVSLNSLAQTAPTNGSSAQQAYNDTMTALAMQQAAVAAAATAGGQRQTNFLPGATLVPPQFITQAIQQHSEATHQQPIAPVVVAPPTQLSTTLPPVPAPAQILSAIATKREE